MVLIATVMYVRVVASTQATSHTHHLVPYYMNSSMGLANCACNYYNK